MRKWLSALLAVALVLSAQAGFCEEEEDAPSQTYVAQDMFSFQYPAQWMADDETYDYENESGYIWIADVYDEGNINVTCSATYVDSWVGVTLYDSDDKTMEEYKNDLDDYYYDQSGLYLKTVLTDAGQVPFLVFTTTDYYGVSLQASTLVNGWEVVFELYAERGGSITGSDRATFNGILASFTMLSEPTDSVWSVPAGDAGDDYSGDDSGDGDYASL